MDASDIGGLIRYHRKRSGLTQKELGTLSGVGKTAVFDIEKGKLSVRLDTLLKLMNVLNIQIEFQSPLIEKFKEQTLEKS